MLRLAMVCEVSPLQHGLTIRARNGDQHHLKTTTGNH
jgi:hypothetical protein